MKKLTQADAEFLGEMEPHKLAGPKFTSHLILFFVFLFLICAFIWAKYTVIDEVTRGEGKVIPSRQIQKVQNLEGGIVKQILVNEGMVVNKGQPLLIIDDKRFQASYKESLTKEVSLEIRYLRLKAETEKSNFSIPAKLAQANPETARFETELYQARKQEYKELLDSYNLAQREMNMTQPLIHKGAASPVEVLRLQRAVTESQSKVTSFRSETLDELNKVKAEWSALKESNAANIDRLDRTTVRSPVKGIVKQLMVYTEGGVVQPGSDLVEIVPLDDTLLVEARIKPKDIGFLHPGQNATVTVTAFDSAIYGTLQGKVEQISADALLDEKKQENYYLVRVRTQKNYLGTQTKAHYIIPGMQSRVDIQTGKKSILDYILSPIIKTMNTALREK